MEVGVFFILGNLIFLQNTAWNQNIIIAFYLAVVVHGVVLLEQESVEIIFVLLSLASLRYNGAVVHIDNVWLVLARAESSYFNLRA